MLIITNKYLNAVCHQPSFGLMARDYCGSYIYRNDTIERVLTENGYIQNGELFFYVRDYQGNVRVVLDHNNQPVEENSYYPYGGLMAATSTEGLQPYKYGGKELDRENGLDLYDSQARWYDPMLARTTTLDPLAEKYYSISPYAWCAANPVKFVDLDGERPTNYEAALMSKASYGDDVELTGGWELMLAGNFSSSGLRYSVFSRTINGKTEYTFATAGTEPTDLNDWENDIKQLLGNSEQYRTSTAIADFYDRLFSGNELTFVGHSLGGGLAIANALKTGRAAITFNPAYLSKETIKKLKLNVSNEKNVTNFTVAGEILSKIQAKVPNLKFIGKSCTLYYSEPLWITSAKKAVMVANMILPLGILRTKTISQLHKLADSVIKHTIDAVLHSLK